MGALTHHTNLDGTVTVTDTRTLAEAQAQAIDRVQAQVATIIAAGRLVTVQGTQRLYQIDPDSQRKILAEGALAQGVLSNTPGALPWESDYAWIAADNSQQPMTAADCYSFSQNINAYCRAIIFNARTLKDSVLALTTNAACDAFDATTGWPSNP